jgi:hypothetical protein
LAGTAFAFAFFFGLISFFGVAGVARSFASAESNSSFRTFNSLTILNLTEFASVAGKQQAWVELFLKNHALQDGLAHPIPGDKPRDSVKSDF